MSQIVVYSAEKAAGLTERIQGANKVAYASLARLSDRFEINPATLSLLKTGLPERARASLRDFDLYYLEDILASTGWNKNDDVFDPIEVWAARATPEHKPFNLGHDSSKVIGHIVANRAIGADSELIADDTAADQLPAKFHIVTSSVIYKFINTDLQPLIEKTIAEIKEGKWFVSMEALITDFDYAVKDNGGVDKVVARSEKTAFLTKHLRAYGGDGVYQGNQIGRVLRSFVFSGKGLVENPGNPESVILATAVQRFAPVAFLNEFPPSVSRPVYGHATVEVTAPSREKKTVMEPNIQAQLDASKAEAERYRLENERLRTEAASNGVKQVQAKLDETVADKAKTEAALKAATDKVCEIEAVVKTTAAELEATKTKLADTEKSLATAAETIAKATAEKVQAERLNQIKATLKVAEGDAPALEKATKLTASLASLSDEAFTGVLASMSMMSGPPVTNNPADGNTTFPHGTAQQPPKATPAPLPPKATTAAKANANPANLAAAEPVQAAALSTETPADGVSAVQRSIASAFGCVVE